MGNVCVIVVTSHVTFYDQFWFFFYKDDRYDKTTSNKWTNKNDIITLQWLAMIKCENENIWGTKLWLTVT